MSLDPRPPVPNERQPQQRNRIRSISKSATLWNPKEGCRPLQKEAARRPGRTRNTTLSEQSVLTSVPSRPFREPTSQNTRCSPKTQPRSTRREKAAESQRCQEACVDFARKHPERTWPCNRKIERGGSGGRSEPKASGRSGMDGKKPKRSYSRREKTISRRIRLMHRN